MVRVVLTGDIEVVEGDCLEWFKENKDRKVHLTFFDPPFRQGKNYRYFDDNQPEEKYWEWIKKILSSTYDITADGGAIYFMQREKNAEYVLRSLRETGWTFQNLIIWKKRTCLYWKKLCNNGKPNIFIKSYFLRYCKKPCYSYCWKKRKW